MTKHQQPTTASQTIAAASRKHPAQTATQTRMIEPLALQRTHGNQAVQRMIQRKHDQPEGAPMGAATSGLGRWVANQLFGTDAERRQAPDEHAQANLDSLGLIADARDASQASTDGNVLTGVVYTPKQAYLGPRRLALTGTAVVLLSGSGKPSASYMPEIAKDYCRLGNVVLMMDYRGFGKSHQHGKQPGNGGTPSEKGLYEDAEAMMRLIGTVGYALSNVLLHGYSLGGPIAAELALRMQKNGTPVKGLVLDRAMTSARKAGSAKSGMRGLAGEVTKSYGGRFSLKQKLALLDAQLPLLLTVAGRSDELSADSKKVAQHALATRPAEATAFVESEDAGHESHGLILEAAKAHLRTMSH